MSKTKSLLGDVFRGFADAFSNKMTAEYMEADYYCLVFPKENEREQYLERFSNLKHKDQIAACVKSKEWADFELTNKMQQIMTKC